MKANDSAPLDLRVAVIDYDAGNLLSVTKALAAVGVQAFLASDAISVLSGDAVILPGVGAAGDAMRALRERDLVEPIRAAVASGKAFMGVCLGQQLLFDSSDEDGGVDCLGLLAGGCHRFQGKLKVPHMGWNNVVFEYQHPLVADIPQGAQFYFVHSYYVEPKDHSCPTRGDRLWCRLRRRSSRGTTSSAFSFTRKNPRRTACSSTAISPHSPIRCDSMRHRWSPPAAMFEIIPAIDLFGG